jgi:hypothetical protein
MGVFGPKYPPRLQEVVSHAERFCQQLSRWEETGQGESAEAHAWLVGRSGEIELVLALALSDWKSERVSIEEAGQSMSTYLLELHAAARIVFGVEDEIETVVLDSAHDGISLYGGFDCCCDEAFLTEVVSGETITRVVTRGRAPPSPCDTWFDPGVVLRELQRDDEDAASTRGARGLVGEPGQQKS